MLLNISKTPKDLQLSKWAKEPTHISKSIYSLFFFFSYIVFVCNHSKNSLLVVTEILANVCL
jgi:hypothetical protein